MNKYELTKSIILTVLVAASGFFSWSLWTYQYNYETLDKSNYIKEVMVNKKAEVREIVKPDKLLYHQANKHLGTDSHEEVEKIITYLASWEFFNIQDISYSLNKEDFSQLVHGEEAMEIIFPTLVPVEQYKSVFHFEEKKLPSFNFDRIVVPFEKEDQDDGKVYFVAYDEQLVYASSVESSHIHMLVEDLSESLQSYPPYLSYETGERHLYILEGEPVYSRNKYFMNLLNVDLFRDALFTNPNVVQKTFLTTEDEYTDSSSMMTTSYQTRLLSYVNPMEETDVAFHLNDLLGKSIEFINDHGGWTDDYHFVESTPQQAIFRHYVDGKPVFSKDGMSEITQIWGSNKVYKYTRPYFTLDILLTSETAEIELPAGRDVIAFLERKEGFNSALLEQLLPAYEMIKDRDEPRLIVLEPVWYYRYNGMWESITTDDLGGEMIGLE